MKTKNKKAKATPQTNRTLVRAPLSSLGGIIAETTKVYREARNGKIPHKEARSLVWMLGQLRAMLETQALEHIEQRLEELESGSRSEDIDAQANRVAAIASIYCCLFRANFSTSSAE